MVTFRTRLIVTAATVFCAVAGLCGCSSSSNSAKHDTSSSTATDDSSVDETPTPTANEIPSADDPDFWCKLASPEDIAQASGIQTNSSNSTQLGLNKGCFYRANNGNIVEIQSRTFDEYYTTTMERTSHCEPTPEPVGIESFWCSVSTLYVDANSKTAFLVNVRTEEIMGEPNVHEINRAQVVSIGKFLVARLTAE